MSRTLPKGFGQGFEKHFERKGSEDHREHLKTLDKHVKLHNQDWKNVVVFNMHPFPIQQHFGDAGLLTIKANKDGEPYRAHMITMYRITKRDQGKGEYEPTEILPVEQAQELEKKYTTQGGVFWAYEDEPFPTEKMKDAGMRQLAHYRNLVRKGRDEWGRHHQMSRVSDAMRQAARFLARIGEVNLNDFEWVEKLKLPICSQCGEDVKPGAKVCKHCEWPLDLAWVRQHRKDLVEKYGLSPAVAGDTVVTLAEADPFMDDETISAEDAKLLGGN